MHREWVERSAHAAGPLQGWDPRLKVGLALLTLVAVSFGAAGTTRESWLRLAALGAVVLCTARAARLPLGRWLARSAVVLLFAAPLAGAALVSLVPGAAPGIPIGGWTLTPTPGGTEAALRLLARAWISVLVTLLLVATTPLPAILAALERWHLPRGFLEACSLVYRYLWVLLEEGRRLLLARRMRGGRVPPWRSGGRILATLFARSLARAHRIEIALRLRGYRGSFPLGARLRWTARDSGRLLVGSAVLAAALLAPRWGGGG